MEVKKNGHVFKFDAQDTNLILDSTWYRQPNGPLFRRIIQEDGRIKTEFLHRMIVDAGPREVVRHIDGDVYNNMRENLTIATKASVLRNRSALKSNRSGLKGACFDKYNNRYRAVFTHNRVRYNLGGFATAEEAHAAWVTKAKEVHGEDFHE